MGGCITSLANATEKFCYLLANKKLAEAEMFFDLHKSEIRINGHCSSESGGLAKWTPLGVFVQNTSNTELTLLEKILSFGDEPADVFESPYGSQKEECNREFAIFHTLFARNVNTAASSRNSAAPVTKLLLRAGGLLGSLPDPKKDADRTTHERFLKHNIATRGEFNFKLLLLAAEHRSADKDLFRLLLDQFVDASDQQFLCRRIAKKQHYGKSLLSFLALYDRSGDLVQALVDSRKVPEDFKNENDIFQRGLAGDSQSLLKKSSSQQKILPQTAPPVDNDVVLSDVDEEDEEEQCTKSGYANTKKLLNSIAATSGGKWDPIVPCQKLSSDITPPRSPSTTNLPPTMVDASLLYDTVGFTPLMSAIALGNVPFVRALVANNIGGDVRIGDKKKGMNALHIACCLGVVDGDSMFDVFNGASCGRNGGTATESATNANTTSVFSRRADDSGPLTRTDDDLAIESSNIGDKTKNTADRSNNSNSGGDKYVSPFVKIPQDQRSSSSIMSHRRLSGKSDQELLAAAVEIAEILLTVPPKHIVDELKNAPTTFGQGKSSGMNIVVRGAATTTPLCLAIQNKNRQIIKMLLQRGADKVLPPNFVHAATFSSFGAFAEAHGMNDLIK